MRFPRPWTAAEFAALLSDPLVHLSADEANRAFALGRSLAGEAELLTLATDPAFRRMGLARDLLGRFEREGWRRGARTAHLEVAADNLAAIALYDGAGWHEVGRRRAYYQAPARPPIDALVMRKPLVSPGGTGGAG